MFYPMYRTWLLLLLGGFVVPENSPRPPSCSLSLHLSQELVEDVREATVVKGAPPYSMVKKWDAEFKRGRWR